MTIFEMIPTPILWIVGIEWGIGGLLLGWHIILRIKEKKLEKETHKHYHQY